MLSFRRSAKDSLHGPEYRTLLERRLATLVAVREPLVLISQIQRSGGTLLSQLFDAHPEVHAHPHELRIGWPTKYDWPEFTPGDPPKRTFARLKEGFEKYYLRGYAKGDVGAGSGAPADGRAKYPFLLPQRLQRDIFRRLHAEWGFTTDRDVLDGYMTSFFNAWLDNQNLYPTPKKAVTAFVPRLGVRPVAGEGFFAVYPDGYLVSVIREPRSWYASAVRHDPDEYADPDHAAALWSECALGAVEAKARHPERTILVSFEQLVEAPEDVVRYLCRRIGLSFDPVLLTPTFNGLPMTANSSFDVAGAGVLKTSSRRESALDGATSGRIESLTAEAFASATAELDDIMS